MLFLSFIHSCCINFAQLDETLTSIGQFVFVSGSKMIWTRNQTIPKGDILFTPFSRHSIHNKTLFMSKLLKIFDMKGYLWCIFQHKHRITNKKRGTLRYPAPLSFQPVIYCTLCASYFGYLPLPPSKSRPNHPLKNRHL